MVSLLRIDKGKTYLTAIRKLFTEYATELGEDLGFQNFERELKDPFVKYGAPYGSLWLAFSGNVAIGCIALQRIDEETCEMKRLYVQPAFRGQGIASMLVNKLLEDAIKLGYRVMVLDTLNRLQPAIQLYLKAGFTICAPYYQNPLPDVVFMEKQLLT